MYNKNKLCKTLDYWSRDMLNFDFLEKGLGIASPTHFMYDFSRKMFIMLCYVNWTNFITWLLLLLEILGNKCIAIVCFPGCDVINFQTNLIFLIEPFFYMIKKSDKNWNILGTKRAFKVKKAFFITLRVLKITGLEVKTALLTLERKQQQP